MHSKLTLLKAIKTKIKLSKNALTKSWIKFDFKSDKGGAVEH